MAVAVDVAYFTLVAVGGVVARGAVGRVQAEALRAARLASRAVGIGVALRTVRSLAGAVGVADLVIGAVRLSLAPGFLVDILADAIGGTDLIVLAVRVSGALG